MYQAIPASAGDGIAVAAISQYQHPLVRELLPPLSPILLGLVAAKNYEREEAHCRLCEPKDSIFGQH